MRLIVELSMEKYNVRNLSFEDEHEPYFSACSHSESFFGSSDTISHSDNSDVSPWFMVLESSWSKIISLETS